MSAFFKPVHLLFFLLSAVLASLSTMILAGIGGAGKGQGLAGGAIILGYGLISGLLGLIAALVAVRLMKERRVALLNRIFAVVLALALIFLVLRYRGRHTPPTGTTEAWTPVLVTDAVAAANPGSGSDANLERIGLGMVAPRFSENRQFYFYGHPNLDKPVDEHVPTDSLVFERSEIGMTIAYAPPWFVPAHMKMDYEILFLRFLSIHTAFIEVVVNETTGQTTYVDRHASSVRYWPEFLLSVSSVEPLEPASTPIRIKPLSHASVVSSPYAFLQPVQVTDQWMQVELLGDQHRSQGRGWIKWRESGRPCQDRKFACSPSPDVE